MLNVKYKGVSTLAIMTLLLLVTLFTVNYRNGSETVVSVSRTIEGDEMFTLSPDSNMTVSLVLKGRNKTPISKSDTEWVLKMAYWPEHLWEDAIQVVDCESDFLVFAFHNNKDKHSSTDRGLFQINDHWNRFNIKSLGLRPVDIYSPVINAKIALMEYERYGWEPWKLSKHCHGLS